MLSDNVNDEEYVNLGRQVFTSEHADSSCELSDPNAAVGTSEISSDSSNPSDEFHAVLVKSGDI